MHPLMSCADLQRVLPTCPLVLDMRFDLSDPQAGRRAFEAQHIPGAHYLHLDAICGGKHDAKGAFRGRHPLPERDAFAALLRASGWHYGRTVVLMDAGSSMFAARGWWMLQWLGHEAVAVLDGGLAAWQAEGRALTEAPTPAPTPTPLFSLRPSRVGALDKAELHARFGRCGLVDARAPERFRGEVEPLDAQAGRIPGARNRPYADNLGADGRFKPSAQLRAEWAGLGPTADTVHSCGSGVSACHNLLALAVAELPVGLLYPGSWSEWSADASLPKARD